MCKLTPHARLGLAIHSSTGLPGPSVTEFTHEGSQSRPEFPPGDDFVPPGTFGRVWRGLRCHKVGEELLTGIWGAEARDAANRPSKPQTTNWPTVAVC